MPFDAPPITLGNLMFGKGHEEAGRGPAFFVGAFGKLLPQVFDRRQPQFVQEQRQTCASMVVALMPLLRCTSRSAPRRR